MFWPAHTLTLAMSVRCPVCESVYDDSNTFCVLDGAALVSTSVAPPAQEPALEEPPPVVPPPASAAPRTAASRPAGRRDPEPSAAASGNRSGVLIGALAGLVVVLGGAVTFLALRPVEAETALPLAVQAQPQSYGGGTGPEAEFVAEAPVADPVPDRDLVQVGTAPPRAASSGPARVDTDGAGLLLREGPGRGYGVAGKMLPGDVVTVERCEPGTPGQRWCSVVYGGVRGWALDGYLAIGAPSRDTDSGLEQAFAASSRVGASAWIDGSETGYVNLRSEPFVGGEVLVQMRPGTAIEVVRCLPYGWSLGGRAIEGRWCFVNTARGSRSISGWASDGALRW